MRLNNGYTPKEYAYSVAVDALQYAMHSQSGELDGLTERQAELVVEAMQILRQKLADEVKLDILTVRR